MTINLDDVWELQRDRWGRPLIVPPDGGKPVPYTRATTVAKTLDDEGSLIKWAQRTTAAGLARRPDLLALLATKLDTSGDIPEQHKADVQRICDEAKEHGGGSKAANLGTSLHAFTEQYDLGQTPTVPADMQADIDAYRTAVEPFEVLAVEQFVVLDEHQIAGTLDRLWRLPDGRVVIADLKTGQNLDYSWRSISVQLAIYAAGTRYHRDLRSPLWADGAVDADTGIVIHLPVGQGRCDLYQVDLRAGTVALNHSIWARRWRSRRDLATPFAVPASPAPLQGKAAPAPLPASTRGHADPQGAAPGRQNLTLRVRAISATDAGKAYLRRHWPVDVPTLKQSDRHTDHELAIIAALCDAAERDLALPFNEHDITRLDEPTAAPVKAAPVRSEWVRPADGRKLGDKGVAKVRSSIDTLDDETRQRVLGWLTEAQANGRAVLLEGKHTERSQAVIACMVACATWTDDTEFLAILLAATLRTDAAAFPVTALGAAFASLTTDEAHNLTRIVERAQQGEPVPVTFADDGAPRLVLDDAA